MSHLWDKSCFSPTLRESDFITEGQFLDFEEARALQNPADAISQPSGHGVA
jgi:hypothetical protein